MNKRISPPLSSQHPQRATSTQTEYGISPPHVNNMLQICCFPWPMNASSCHVGWQPDGEISNTGVCNSPLVRSPEVDCNCHLEQLLRLHCTKNNWESCRPARRQCIVAAHHNSSVIHSAMAARTRH